MTLTRRFPLELETDGRTLHGRCVPFGEITDVQDRPDRPAYREMFVKGAFRGIVKAPNRVSLGFEHLEGLANTPGWCQKLEERDDGLYGEFRVAEGPLGDHALELHRGGLTRYFSIGFIPRRTQHQDGVAVRTRVDLHEVSLCRNPSYVGTEAAVRAALVDLPVHERNQDLDRRLRALGYGL